MPSYIPKQPKRERGQSSIKLDRDVLRKLEQYGRFLESSRDYIINTALELVFRKDKSFSAWLETEGAAGDAEGSRVAADLSVQDRSRHAVKQPDRNVTPGSNSEASGNADPDRESHSAEPSPQLLDRHRLVSAIAVSR